MHNWKKRLTLLLVAALILSLMPVSAFAGDIEIVEEFPEEELITVVDHEKEERDPNDIIVTEDDNQERNMDYLLDQLPDDDALDDPTGTQYYFYRQLNDCEKVLYWEVSKATYEEPTVTITGLSPEQIDCLGMTDRVIIALFHDQPYYNFLWKNAYCSGIDEERGTIIFTMVKNPLSTDYTISKCNARIKQIVGNVGEEENVYVRYRKLATLLTYEMSYEFASNGTNGFNFADGSASDISGGLLYKKAVCSGFSALLKVLCDELNIPCVIIGNSLHAWNLVQIEGNWYSTDAANYVNHSYDWSMDQIAELLGDTDNDLLLNGSRSNTYLQRDEYFASDFFLGRPDENFSFPTISETSYRYEGLYNVIYNDVPLDFLEPPLSFVYEVNSDGSSCTITRSEGQQAGDLLIPETIDGYTVTKIGDYAFYGCEGFTGTLIIPDSVNTIEHAAFSNCYNISSVEIPDGVIWIGEWAFYNCNNLSEVIIPDSVRQLGGNAFFDCYQLSNIHLSSNITVINQWTFSNCESLKSIEISPAVKTIGPYAFYQCEDLETIYIPNTLELIQRYAFRECESLTSVQYGGTTEEWKNIEFETGNAHIISALIFTTDNPEGTRILEGNCGNDARWSLSDDGTLTISGTGMMADYDPISFSPWYPYSEEIERIVIEEGITKIGDSAFVNCVNITEVNIPDSVEVLGGAFSGCINLKTITLPDSLASIGGGAFSGCDSIINTDFLSGSITSIEAYTFYRCSGLREANIPSGVKSIKWEAFSGCVNLERITLPGELETIEACALVDCRSLKKIIIPRSVSVIGEQAIGYMRSSDNPSLNDLVLVDGLVLYGYVGSQAETYALENNIEFRALNEKGHHLVKHEAIDATCKEVGNCAYWECEICGQYFSDSDSNTAIEENDWVIPALGHSLIEHSAVESTCTDEGNSKYWSCERCCECFSDAEGMVEIEPESWVIPATGHVWGEPVWRWTGFMSATATFTCTNDPSHVDAVDAAITNVRIEPSCEADGSVIYTASAIFNGQIYTDTETETIPATGHTLGDAVIENEAAATCEAEGHYDEVVYCTVCGKELSRETKTIPATGHTPGDAVIENEVAASCEAEGHYDEVVYCTACGKELSRETKTTAALGHDWGEATYTWAADNSSVTATRVCKRDASHVETETANTAAVETTAATCEEAGVKTYTANFTNTAFETQTMTETIPATGHTPGEIVIENETAATCEAEGHYDEVVYCTVCHKELSRETKTVAALGHDWCEPVWNWKEYESAAASFVCANDSSHVKTVNAAITVKELSDGTKRYTARVVFMGEEYTDVRTYIPPQPTIAVQPKSQSVAEGKTVTFTVTATGGTLGYQWYYRTSSTGSWKKCSGTEATTNSLSVEAKSYRNGYQYRCKVTNQLGYKYSRNVTLTVISKPTITTQPVSVTAAPGSTVVFSVTADGATGYQWQYRTSSTGTWKNSTAASATTAALSVTAESYRNGYQYRCKVKNAAGTVTSEAATLTVISKPVITTQPKSQTASAGTTVKFTVKATGAESYQWYYRTSSTGSWKACSGTSATKATLSVEAKSYRNGYQYRCKLTNEAGYVRTSIVTLTVSTSSAAEILVLGLDAWFSRLAWTKR